MIMLNLQSNAYFHFWLNLCSHDVQYGDGKKRRKPNYSSVDLSEVEWEDKDDTVRHQQIYIKPHHSAVLNI